MKRIISLLFVLSFSFTNAQSLDDVPLKDIDVKYMLIRGQQKAFSTKLNITVDFGQRTKLFSGKNRGVLKDKDGKVLELNSMVDALNFFYENGYEFISAYTTTVSNQNVYNYLLRKIKE